MGGYATMQTRLWSETATWPPDAKLLYIWTWTNDHVHGVTGIGRVPDVVIAAETGLNGLRLKRAKRFISQVKKVLWFEDNWYWVVGRMRHTVFANAEHTNPSLFIAATKYFAEHRVPQPLAKELGATYPQLGTTLVSGCIHTPPHPADVPNPNPNPNPNPSTPISPLPGAQTEISELRESKDRFYGRWNELAAQKLVKKFDPPRTTKTWERVEKMLDTLFTKAYFRENQERLFSKLPAATWLTTVWCPRLEQFLGNNDEHIPHYEIVLSEGYRETDFRAAGSSSDGPNVSSHKVEDEETKRNRREQEAKDREGVLALKARMRARSKELYGTEDYISLGFGKMAQLTAECAKKEE